MKLEHYCGVCTIKQAMQAMKNRSISPDRQIEILQSLTLDIPKHLAEPTPSHFQSILLHKFSEYLQISDIYVEDKMNQNEMAANLIPLARDIALRSANPLYTAAQLAVEGNSIDQLFIANYDLESKLSEIANHRFVVDHFSDFEKRLPASNKIVFVLDNAGEIFFDKLFIEIIQKWKAERGIHPAEITCIVKSGPVLNDATLEDASIAHLEEVATVIASGSNYLGCPMDKVNGETLAALSSADLIIAKGQANYETLEDQQALWGRIFLFLKAKCLHVSAHLGVPEGSSVLFSPTH